MDARPGDGPTRRSSTVQAAITRARPGRGPNIRPCPLRARRRRVHELQSGRPAARRRVVSGRGGGVGGLWRARQGRGSCRCDLATQVLEPLGRFDEALAQLGVDPAAGDLADAERTWLLLNEGLVLMSANRLEAPSPGSARVADLGYVAGQPADDRGGGVGSRHGRCPARGRGRARCSWFGTAENTALGTDDDLPGRAVPLRRGDGARRARRARDGRASPRVSASNETTRTRTRCALAKFILEARRGVRGDVDAQLDDDPAGRVVAGAARVRSGGGSRRCDCRCPATAPRLGAGAHHARVQRLQDARRAQDVRGAQGTPASRACRGPLEPAAPAAFAARPAASRGPTGLRTRPGDRIRVIGGPIVVETARGTDRAAGRESAATRRRRRRPRWRGQLRPDQRVDLARRRRRGRAASGCATCLLRLRRVAGDIVVRSGSGVRLAPDVELRPVRVRAIGQRRDVGGPRPTRPGRPPRRAGGGRSSTGRCSAEFEYEEWAVDARRNRSSSG